VLRSPPTWFTHYNEVHPHHALRYRSPRQFIRANLTPRPARSFGGNNTGSNRERVVVQRRYVPRML
jgi:hypothetical protein